MLIWMPCIKRSCKGFFPLVLAIICGEIAIQGLQSPTLEGVLCARFGRFFNQDNFWYLFSDLAMGFLLLFYLVSHQVSSSPSGTRTRRWRGDKQLTEPLLPEKS
mmetsp:Transcript_4126/g.14775  ORF Transcript_4126/g.14775 Transcript_4126/m.14775 type:complete len:104 (-) Transcript_4126:805-1116(-)